MRVGSVKTAHIKIKKCKHFSWSSEKVKEVGFYIRNDENLNTDNNLQPRLQYFENYLKQWQNRKLTLLGNVLVGKTFALPNNMHTLSRTNKYNDYIVITECK